MSKIAISNIAWPIEADEEALELVVAAGYSALEIAPVKVFGPLADSNPEVIKSYSRRVADQGLPIVAMQGILFGVQGASLFGSDEERAALGQALRDVARVAGLIGGVPCVFGAPKMRDKGQLTTIKAMDMAISFYRKIAPVFADQGSTLCFEANPTIYACNFITHTEDAMALVEDVKTPGFALQFDVGTVVQNAETDLVIERAAAIAEHLHVSQPHLSEIDSNVDHQRIARAVEKGGYKKNISVEMKTPEKFASSIIKAIKIAKVYQAR